MCTSLHGKAVSAHPITKVTPTPITEVYALAGADVGKAKRFIPEIVFPDAPEAPKPLKPNSVSTRRTGSGLRKNNPRLGTGLQI